MYYEDYEVGAKRRMGSVTLSKSRPAIGIVACRTCLESQEGVIVMDVLMRFMVQLRARAETA